MTHDRSDTTGDVGELRRQLLVVAAKYLPLAVALTLLGGFGVQMLTQSLGLRPVGFALGWIIAGCGGAVGTLAICAAAILARDAILQGRDAVGVGRAINLTRFSRLIILLSAVGAETITIVLAPAGMDRGFAMVANGVIAGSLALFALIAGDIDRAIRRFDSVRNAPS